MYIIYIIYIYVYNVYIYIYVYIYINFCCRTFVISNHRYKTLYPETHLELRRTSVIEFFVKTITAKTR